MKGSRAFGAMRRNQVGHAVRKGYSAQTIR